MFTNFVSVSKTAATLAPTTYVGTKELVNLRQHTGAFRIISPVQSVPAGSIQRTNAQTVKLTSTDPVTSVLMTNLFNSYESGISKLPVGVQLIFNDEGDMIGVREGNKVLGGLGKVDEFANLLGAPLPKMGIFHNLADFAQIAVRLITEPGLTWATSRCTVWVGMSRAIHITESSLAGILLCGLTEAHMKTLVEIKADTPGYLYAPLILYLMLDVLPEIDEVLGTILVNQLMGNI